MAKKEHDPRQQFFFDEPPQYLSDDLTFKPFDYPVWTRNKARLVQRYLRYFVFITRHGTYIDGFAGPQEPDKLDTCLETVRSNRCPHRYTRSAVSHRSSRHPRIEARLPAGVCQSSLLRTRILSPLCSPSGRRH
jgi:hypothetical protein